MRDSEPEAKGLSIDEWTFATGEQTATETAVGRTLAPAGRQQMEENNHESA
jgi:hypothetical protein